MHPPKPSSSNESDDDYYQYIAVWLLIQLVAYNAIGCLYIYTSSGRKGEDYSLHWISYTCSAFFPRLLIFKQISSPLLHFLGQYHGYIRVLLCLDSHQDLPLAPKLPS